MGDFKIQGITPVAGKLKLGGSNVSKIYNGSTLLWPIGSVTPGQVEICNLIWTNTNSSETELTAGGNMAIATNATEWIDAINNATPIACYWDFDINNASYGLLYNTYAADLIKIPTGFRLPTSTDLSDLNCVVTAGTYNPIGANPGNWDPAQLTNTTGLGDSGFNAQGYGYLALTFGTTVTFSRSGEAEFYWKNPLGPSTKMYGYGIASGSLYGFGFGDAANLGAFIRFVKDA